MAKITRAVLAAACAAGLAFATLAPAVASAPAVVASAGMYHHD